jgi:hypothetical protein
MSRFLPRAHRRRMNGARAALRAALLLALALVATTAGAQNVSAPALKAAFVFNFAKFVTWPADVLAAKRNLTICVADDNSVAEALEPIINHQLVDGHELKVVRVKADGPLGACHILFAGGLDSRRARALIDALQGTAVMSISDCERFADTGGVVQLVLERDRMRFVFNLGAARRARLTVSSKLLQLAKSVKDDNDAR